MDLSRFKALEDLPQRLTKTYSFDLPGGFVFEPSILMAILMVGLIFLLILTLGSLRKRYTDWAFKGLWPGIAFGFAIALILEGILVVGGRTILTEALGWKSAPKPISNALDAGRNRLVDVLGVTEEIPVSSAQTPPSSKSVIDSYSLLSLPEQEEVQALLCSQRK